MDRKSSNNGGDLGYSNQESDENRPRDDVPSGACAGGSGEEQLKEYRDKAKQKHDLYRNEQSANAQGSHSATSSENEDVFGPTSDAQQLAYGMYTQTITLPAISPQPGSLKENMANMTLEKKVQSTSSSVKSGEAGAEQQNTDARANQNANAPVVADENACLRRLSELGYNDRNKLRQLLDQNGIEKLVRKLFEDKHEYYLDVWRACHGGVDPAMGLIYTLGQSQLTTLKEFRDLAHTVEPINSQTLLGIIDNYIKNMDEVEKRRMMNTRIDQLPLNLMDNIAREISAKPHPVTEQHDPLWKSIACAADIDMTSIDNLDIPAIQGSRCESMTMVFLKIANQRYPTKKVAWLANGLLAVGRCDVIRLLICFDDAGNHCCEKEG